MTIGELDAMNILDTIRQPWFRDLPQAQQHLVRLSLELLEREKRLHSHFSDYSFVIFPISKAYEGFIKNFFYKRSLISYEVYRGKRFRVGRSLNPDISQHYQDEWWLYDDLSRICGATVARQVWNAWIECRNHIFHYFPESQSEHTLPEIEKKVFLLLDVMRTVSES